MRIAFISSVSELSAIGPRILSAWARRLGHESKLIFLPATGKGQVCSDAAAKAVSDLCSDCDMAGLSVYTGDFFTSIKLSEQLRRSRKDLGILWGGIHPTVRPKECLEHCDLVCVGEAETALRQLMEGQRAQDITGLWYKSGGQAVDNGIGPLTEDLAALPFQDFSFVEHYLVDPVTGGTAALTTDVYRSHLQKVSSNTRDLFGVHRCFYRTLASRGCPFSCTFCSNDVYHRLYSPRHYRVRPVGNVIAELKAVTSANPFIGMILLTDDVFFARKTEDIADFCKQYKHDVGLPFYAITYPNFLADDKLKLMLDAGMCRLSMGIQSGSPGSLKRYRRRAMPDAILNAARIADKYRNRMLPPKYDILVNDPFETREEQRESIVFLSRVPASFALHSLVLLPGTQLSDMALEKGLIHDEQKETYTKKVDFIPANYYDLLMACLNIPLVPRWLIRALAKDPLFGYAEKHSWFIAGCRKLTQWLQRVSEWLRVKTLWLTMRRRRRAVAASQRQAADGRPQTETRVAD